MIKPHIICTLHDLDGGLVKRLVDHQWGRWMIKSGAASVDFVATPNTYRIHSKKIRHFNEMGGLATILEEQPGSFSTSNRVQNSHMQALSKGVNRADKDNDWVIYMDGDRLISDLEHNSLSWHFLLKELQEPLSNVDCDLISLIRDHHVDSLARRITETPVNLALYETVGVQTDPFSSYIAMRRNLAEHIIKSDRTYLTFPALEWVIEAFETDHKMMGYRPIGSHSRMVGIFEDTLPDRGDIFGLMTLTVEDFPLLRGPKELDVTTELEFRNRLGIARNALNVIRSKLGDNEHLQDATSELSTLETERTSPLVEEVGLRRRVDIR